MTARRRITLTVLALLLAFWMFVAWSIPYNPIDDFQWGMEDGLRWWLGGLLNGRYVGNLFSILMCRFQLGKAVIGGGTMFLIPVLSAVLAARGDETRFLPALLLCNSCVLLMSDIMWQSVYGWVSGLSIYGVSAMLFLLWLLTLRRVERERKHPRTWGGLMLGFTLALGMFVENLTLLVLGGSVILALYSLRDRELRLPFLACLLGAALAMLPMFCNGVVRELTSSGSAIHGLRNLIFEPGDSLLVILQKILGWYVGRVLPICFLRGVQTALPLSLLTVFALWSGPLRLLTPLGVLPLAFHLYMTGPVDFWDLEAGPMWMLVSLLCWLLPLLALLVQHETSWRVRWGRALILLAAPLSLLPFTLTDTMGHRMYYFPMFMVALAAADTAAPLLRRLPVTCLAAAALAVLMVPRLGIAHTLLDCTRLREQLTREAVETGADALLLPTDRYQWVITYSRNPENMEYACYYRRFYHIPDDVTLIFLRPGSYETWPDISPEMWEGRLEFWPSDDFTSSLP